MFGLTRQTRPSKAKRLSRMQLAKGAIGNMPARRASGSKPGGVARGRNRSKSRRPSRRRAALTQPPASGVNSSVRRPAVRRKIISTEHRVGIARQLPQRIAVERDAETGQLGNGEHAFRVEAPAAARDVIHIG